MTGHPRRRPDGRAQRDRVASAARALVLLVLAPVAALGGASARTPQVELNLVAEPTGTVATDTQWVALDFRIIPDWHIYWLNPGDSGEAPTVHWTLPQGWQAGPIHWPIPKRIPVGPLTSYGYERQATLLVPIRRPGPPDPVAQTIRAQVNWLVCEVECLPQSAELALELPAVTSGHAGTADRLFTEARQHLPTPLAGGRFRLDGETLHLSVTDGPWHGLAIRDAWLASTTWGEIAPHAEQTWRLEDGERVLQVAASTGYLPPAGDAPLKGLLVVTTGNEAEAVTRGYQIHAQPVTAAAPGASPDTHFSLWWMLASAFAGGILLNLMPCVLPVLSIKILGFADQSHGSRGRLAMHGLLFAFGVLVSFAALAGMLLALRSAGASIGWGFQLQSPLVVTLLAALMLLVALNLSGVFQVGQRLMGLAGAAQLPQGRLGPVFNGMLATLVASPCTAPFMGAALGYAAVQPAPVAFAVFMALALGFASPVLMLSMMPGWTRRLPRPGPWMERLRHWLALPMYGASLWLVWVLSQQLESSAFAATLGAIWLIGAAAWGWGQAQAGARGHGWFAGVAAAAGLALALGLDQAPTRAASPGERALAWSPERVRALQAEGRPVFVNFTAAWCISCKVNERLALDRPGVRAAMAARDVAYLEGDWTRQDPAISAELARHGRNGVPLYLVYPPRPGGAPEVLPQLLTENLVLAALGRL